MVGQIPPGFEINDNPATGGRSIGYGSPVVAYGAPGTSWVQEDPASLRLHPLPPEGRVSPDFTQGRMVGYGAGPLDIIKTPINLPVVGAVSVGIIIIAVVGVLAFMRYKKTGKVF